MGIPADWEGLIVSNDGWYLEESTGWLRSNVIINNGSTSITVERASSVIIMSDAEGPCDYVTVTDKDDVLLESTQGRQNEQIEVALDTLREPFTFTYKKDGSVNAGRDCGFIISLVKSYLKFGDFKNATIEEFEKFERQRIILSADSSALLSEGVGLQVTGVAYYPATKFRIGDTCTIFDENNNVLFEYTDECYAVNVNNQDAVFIYLFDGNRQLLYTAHNASACVKMTGLVEQVVTADYINDYSEEIFIEQIAFTPNSLPVFSNHNQTKEEAYPSPTISFKFVEKSLLINFPTHDRLTLIDPNGEQYPAGRIKGTVKLQGTPVSKKVMCFTQCGQIVAETYSDKFGNFEFSELRHDKKYMITAQAGHEVGTPPDFHPDTVGYITPEVYKL